MSRRLHLRLLRYVFMIAIMNTNTLHLSKIKDYRKRIMLRRVKK